MEVEVTLDDSLKIMSEFNDRYNKRAVTLKNLQDGSRCFINGPDKITTDPQQPDQHVTCAGFDVSLAHGEVHLVHPQKGHVIIKEDGQVETSLYKGKISSSVTAATVGPGQAIVGASSLNGGNISVTMNIDTVGPGTSVTGYRGPK
jgi:hypothetical protein